MKKQNLKNQKKSKLIKLILVLTVLFSVNTFAQDKLLPSATPPGGLTASQVPQFVTFGFDDCYYSGLAGATGSIAPDGTGGMIWEDSLFNTIKNLPGSGNSCTYDGAKVKAAFYCAAIYADTWMTESNTYIKRALHFLYADGNEIGNHTYHHNQADSAYAASDWQTELTMCNTVLTRPFDPNELTYSPDATKGVGENPDSIFGFRTPYLQYNNNLYPVLKSLGFTYDCSIEEGWQSDMDGTNYLWPYTLDQGSPGNEYEWQNGYPLKHHLDPVAGVWENPVYAYIAPPDNLCAQYGLSYSLRSKIAAGLSWFDTSSGKITGLDYNCVVPYNIGGCNLTKEEYLAVLEYTLDQRLAGNRCPFNVGCHTNIYSSHYDNNTTASVATGRQWVLKSFIQYALSKPNVRIVTPKQLINWLRNPCPLQASSGPFTLTINQSSNGTITVNPQKAQYNMGDTVTVTATPSTGYQLTGWTGAASGTTNPVKIVMNFDKTISASFSLIPGQCPNELDLLNTGIWTGQMDAMNYGSTIAATFTLSGGVITCPWTIAKQSNDSTYDTYVTLISGLPSGTSNLTGLSQVTITYKSDQPLLLELPQPSLANSGESYQYNLIATGGNFQTFNIPINSFAQPSWSTGLSIPLALDSVTEVDIQPNVDVTTSSVSGTVVVSQLELCREVTGISQHSMNNSDINIYGISKGDLYLYSSKSGKYNVDVYTIDGKLVYDSENNISEGINNIGMNGSLSNGIYLVKVMNNQTVTVKKVVVTQ